MGSCQSVVQIPIKLINIEYTDKSKKRKLADGAGASSKSAPPTKKIAVGPGTAKAGVKKEAKVVVTAVNAKADSSFFSTPKSKPKLPSFKKAAAPAANPSIPASDAAGMSSAVAAIVNGVRGEDAFQEAVKAMAPKRTVSPAVSTPEPVSVPAPAAASTSGKTVKKRKSVTWAADDQLRKVRIIEKAVYDDDPADVMNFVLLFLQVSDSMSRLGCSSRA